ncbi:MAG: Nitrilase/cyanide hydratase and apolipoprotein N-acyltransferase [Ignavibacteria bacterium]|nr:Nitrilase/cyanide hydratase and apolipoprotein N-acyltransferase [Ignavibacteria bacterium]
MKITIVQFAPIFGEKENNIEKIINYIKSDSADIILFPELCTTGYFFTGRAELSPVAEYREGEFCSEMKQLAVERNIIIIAGFAEKAADKIYNSCGLFFPKPEYNSIYRKTHLFYKEKFSFEAGDTGFFVVDYKEWDIRIGTMICYDWRFPESARSLALQGADLIVCPSNLVTDVWQNVMSARALENMVWLAVSNRCGTESRNGEELVFKGNSAMYDTYGRQLGICSADNEEALTIEFQPHTSRNKSFNEFNDIFNDRRPEYYK